MSNETTNHSTLKQYLLNALATLTGMFGGLFRYFEPLMKDAMGQFLQAALPLAEQLILSYLTGAKATKLDDQARSRLADEIVTTFTSKLKALGIQITHGMALYALDTAFHSMKLNGTLPNPTPANLKP